MVWILGLRISDGQWSAPTCQPLPTPHLGNGDYNHKGQG